MATAPGRNRCVTCGKEKATLRCGGCLQEFCYNNFGNHRQELSKQLDEVEVNRDLFRQILTEQTTNPQKHVLIQQVDKWERDSINKIRETADEAREEILKNTTGYIRELETKLNKLTEKLRQCREENDFFETDLRHWNEELTRLTQQLTRPSNINLRQDATPLVTKIYVDIIPGKSDASYTGTEINNNFA
jgi:chromosome segregation ATPase